MYQIDRQITACHLKWYGIVGFFVMFEDMERFLIILLAGGLNIPTMYTKQFKSISHQSSTCSIPIIIIIITCYYHYVLTAVTVVSMALNRSFEWRINSISDHILPLSGGSGL